MDATATLVVNTIVTLVVTLIGSGGLWTFLIARMTKKDAKNDMLIGLAHDRIIYLGESYIQRGYISTPEYENLNDYLFKPYKKLGGNGSAERIMREVEKLPIKN